MKVGLGACIVVAGALGTVLGCSSPALQARESGNAIREQSELPVMNGMSFNPTSTPKAYRYIVAGHIYGAPLNKKSIFPAASLLGNLDRINRAQPEFFMSLGDAVRLPSPIQFKTFRSSFLDRVSAPILNAVGNHDVASRERYLAEFPGSTSYLFTHGRVLHIVVDTELDVGRISGAQLEWLLESLLAAESNDSISSVALYGHKLLYVVGRDEFEVVSRHLNSHLGYQADALFNQNLLPALRRLAEKKQVTWFAGDIGCAHSLPLFYVKEEQRDLTFVATGIGDTENDAILRVDVEESGRMSFRVLRLDGLRALNLETYGVEFWRDYFQKKVLSSSPR